MSLDRLVNSPEFDDGGTKDVFIFVKQALEDALGQTITETGRGLGGGDIWFNYQGREYYLSLAPSGNQIAKESN